MRRGAGLRSFPRFALPSLRGSERGETEIATATYPKLEDLIAQALVERADTGNVCRCRRCQSLIIGEGQEEGHSQACGPESLELVYRVEGGKLAFALDREAPLRALARSLQGQSLVRLAVLFGSRARGDETPLSDIDLLVDWDEEEAERRLGPLASFALGSRLEDAIGLEVEVVTLSQAREQAMFFADILAEGLVLLDRDGTWRALKAEESDVVAKAQREEKRLMREAAEAIRELQADENRD